MFWKKKQTDKPKPVKDELQSTTAIVIPPELKKEFLKQKIVKDVKDSKDSVKNQQK